MTPLTAAINAATYAPPLAVAARYAVRRKIELGGNNGICHSGFIGASFEPQEAEASDAPQPKSHVAGIARGNRTQAGMQIPFSVRTEAREPLSKQETQGSAQPQAEIQNLAAYLRDHADALPALVTVIVLAVGLGVMVVNAGH